nr:unnamed protein product [Digitaria exilis]
MSHKSPFFGRRSTLTSSPYFEPSPRAPSTSESATDLTGVEAAAAAPPMHRRRPFSDLPPASQPPPIDSCSPSFGRRNSGDEPRTFLHQGAVADGLDHLIPADGEGTPENGAGEGTVDPEANPQLAQEGKPRSIT